MQDDEVIGTPDCIIKKGYTLECKPDQVYPKEGPIIIQNEISLTIKDTAKLCRKSCLRVSNFFRIDYSSFCLSMIRTYSAQLTSLTARFVELAKLGK